MGQHGAATGQHWQPGGGHLVARLPIGDQLATNWRPIGDQLADLYLAEMILGSISHFVCDFQNFFRFGHFKPRNGAG